MKYKTLKIIPTLEEDVDIVGIPESKMVTITDPHIIDDTMENFLLQVKMYDPFANRGFYLNGAFDWVLGRTLPEGHLALIPFKREGRNYENN